VGDERADVHQALDHGPQSIGSPDLPLFLGVVDQARVQDPQIVVVPAGGEGLVSRQDRQERKGEPVSILDRSLCSPAPLPLCTAVPS